MARRCAAAGSATSADGWCLINEVKQQYETKSFDLYRKLSARVNRRRANAKQPATQKGPAKDDDLLWVSRDERCPPDNAATHVFNGAFSAADLFNRALPRAGVYEDANATSNEQFIRASASNDNEHSGVEKDAAACHE